VHKQLLLPACMPHSLCQQNTLDASRPAPCSVTRAALCKCEGGPAGVGAVPPREDHWCNCAAHLWQLGAALQLHRQLQVRAGPPRVLGTGRAPLMAYLRNQIVHPSLPPTTQDCGQPVPSARGLQCARHGPPLWRRPMPGGTQVPHLQVRLRGQAPCASPTQTPPTNPKAPAAATAAEAAPASTPAAAPAALAGALPLAGDGCGAEAARGGAAVCV
jgi:hypothetical protein